MSNRERTMFREIDKTYASSLKWFQIDRNFNCAIVVASHKHRIARAMTLINCCRSNGLVCCRDDDADHGSNRNTCKHGHQHVRIAKRMVCGNQMCSDKTRPDTASADCTHQFVRLIFCNQASDQRACEKSPETRQKSPRVATRRSRAPGIPSL